MTNSWIALIAQMGLIKQRLAEHDKKGLWEHHLPRVAATEARLQTLERHLDEPLAPDYRAFLRHADGWNAFYQTVNLFGVDDLLGSARFDQAAAMLGRLEDNAILRASSLHRHQVLPIAATSVDLDLFVITRTSASQPGSVIWFAGEEIDRFINFEEFFRAMMDYERAELQDLSTDRSYS